MGNSGEVVGGRRGGWWWLRRKRVDGCDGAKSSLGICRGSISPSTTICNIDFIYT